MIITQNKFNLVEYHYVIMSMIMEIKINVIKRIQFIEVTNANGMKVTFSNLGASILSIIYGDKMMTSSPKHFNDFSRHDIYHGKTIGQIAGRVKEGKVIINGKEYQMDKNEGENTLHGGALGISNVPWDIQRFHKDNVFTVIYSFRKKKKFAYLPGTVTYYVGYTIKDDEDKIYMTYKVFSDEDTVVSITNHTFFCLGEEDAKNLYLTLKSDTFAIPNDETLLFEQFKKVNEVMDFRKKKRIGKHIDDSSIADVRARGYDHYYLFNKDNNQITLESDHFKLIIDTDFKGAVIYSDNYSTQMDVLNSKENVHRGLAIEPEDSPFERTIVKKDAPYERNTIYSFSKK